VAGLALAAGCDSEPKPASTATLFNKEEVHGAIQELDSQIGALEGDVEDFDSESWRDVVPRVREGAESVRGALNDLKKTLGYRRILLAPDPFTRTHDRVGTIFAGNDFYRYDHATQHTPRRDKSSDGLRSQLLQVPHI
jgi:hypothetical protein